MLIVTSQINVQFTSFVYNMSRSKVTRLYSPKNIWYVICDKKNLPWFVIWYDFYPTRCMFSIPSPRLGDRKHKTRWLKIISNHKPWEILYIQYTTHPIISFNVCACFVFDHIHCGVVVIVVIFVCMSGLISFTIYRIPSWRSWNSRIPGLRK
jgi:hypothetical protein